MSQIVIPYVPASTLPIPTVMGPTFEGENILLFIKLSRIQKSINRSSMFAKSKRPKKAEKKKSRKEYRVPLYRIAYIALKNACSDSSATVTSN